MVQARTERATGRDKGAYSANGCRRGGSCWSVHGEGLRCGRGARGERGAEARDSGKMGLWLAGGARGERDLRMVERLARIWLGGENDRGGSVWVLSVQMRRGQRV